MFHDSCILNISKRKKRYSCNLEFFITNHTNLKSGLLLAVMNLRRGINKVVSWNPDSGLKYYNLFSNIVVYNKLNLFWVSDL